MVNNLIKSLLGGISRNDFWVSKISCILSSPPNFVARTHLMLQKLIMGSPSMKQITRMMEAIKMYNVISEAHSKDRLK